MEHASHEERLAWTDAWLRRMAGKYRYKGFLTSDGHLLAEVTGIIDCTGIGKGPGLQCVNNTNITPDFTPADSLRAIKPLVTLLGFDPTTAEVRMMYGNTRGLAEYTQTRLKIGGEKGKFIFRCVNSEWVQCRKVLYVTAPAEGAKVEVLIQFWLRYFEDLTPVAEVTVTMERVQEFSPDEIRQGLPGRW